MELAANQGLLNTDPKLAIQYSLEMQAGNEQLVAKMEEHGTGESQEGFEKAGQVKEVSAQLRSMGFDDWPTKKLSAARQERQGPIRGGWDGEVLRDVPTTTRSTTTRSATT
jgi:hypothetical protein